MTLDDLALFERARGLEAADRDRLLREACRGDAALEARVRAMLAADGAPHSLLDCSPRTLAGGLTDPATEAFEGRRLGPYRLIRVLGRGGMGVVYLAERDDVGMQVALKVISAGHASPEAIARFHYERRVLALLEHPHIARFLDAGLADDATPWFAMEYVEGRPIDAWCDQQRLSVEDRVALFTDVVEAVAYVHRNLLVHRDLKPSNILVSAEGRVKLVDFGIAKLLSDEVPGRRTITEATHRPLTPDFASPEQIRGEPLTPASDVYQLGLVFHELLTGRRVTGPGGQPLDHLRRALEVDPVLASARIRDRPDETPGVEAIARLRSTTPDRLRRQLRGDLDNIVRMALHPAPARRYPTGQQLLDDLRRHRDSQPILARPDSVIYRAARFVRRHRAVSALAVVLQLVLVASALVFWLQARRVALERDRAGQLASVLERLVLFADPTRGARDTTANTAVLEEAKAQARSGLRRDPVTWGRILVAISVVYRNRGDIDSAATLAREAVNAMEPGLDEDHPVLIEAMGWAGTIAVEQGRFADGLRYLERAVVHARMLNPRRQAEVGASLVNLGYGLQVSGDDAGAVKAYREAIGLLTTLPDSGGMHLDRALINRGFIAERFGDDSLAEASFRLAWDRRRATLAEDAGPTLNAMSSLARALTRLGRLDEAETLSARALAIRRRVHREPHMNLAESLGLHSLVLARRGRLAEAEALSRESVAMAQAALGPRHMSLAYTMFNHGTLITEQAGRPAEGVAIMREAVGIYRATAGDAHPATLLAMVSLAEVERRLGRALAAEELLRPAVMRLDSLWGDRPSLAPPLTALGRLLATTGRCAEAAPHLRRALALAAARWPEAHRNVREPREALAACD